MSGPFTPRQERIWHFIADHIDRRGYPPTVRDIATGCDISSTSVVAYNARRLEQGGVIRIDRMVSRGTTLIRRPDSHEEAA